MSGPEHFRTTYNEVHKLIRASAAKIAEYKPDIFIAIGALELLPSRVHLDVEQNPQVEGKYHRLCSVRVEYAF